MSKVILCPHCLMELEDGFGGTCPHCGKSLENANPEGALPFGTQLGDRYTVGGYLRADGDGLCYRGVENEARRYVLIKEFFPMTLCNGRGKDGALMPKEGREVLFKTSRMDFKDLYDELHTLTPTTGLSQILEVLEENNTVYAVEESEKGMTLTHYLSLRSRNMTPADACRLLQPVMEGVEVLHKAGLIHRGICPDNILLPIDGTARLTGYGTLALRTAGSELKAQLYAGYAAPEQYSAAEFSGSYTDVYALAAVTYRLVTGQTPPSAAQRKQRDTLESARSLDSAVPGYFAQVLACAMRLDSQKRMQTVPELMNALADPEYASAMFERGDNQISTKKILGASLVVIFVLVVLMMWSLLGGSGDSTPKPTPTPSAAAESTDTQEEAAEVIPDLVGKNYQTEIKNSDLYQSYRIVMTEENSSDVAEGCVISQKPLPGTLKTEVGQIIEIVVSKGPALAQMPNVVGFPQEKAEQLLKDAGIQYRIQTIENDGQYAAGSVARCDVTAGTQFDASKTVVNVYIAQERDDSFVTATPTPTPEDSGITVE